MSDWKTIADRSLFALGVTGAGYTIFVYQTENPYVYGLILALLRIGTTIVDKLFGGMTKK